MAYLGVVPVVSVCSVDRVLRDVSAAELLCDLAGAVVVQHDLDGDGLLHRTVYDPTGVAERVTLELDHGCLSCALREDVLPTVRRLASGDAARGPRRPSAIVLALPVSAEALPVVRALRDDTVARPAAVLTSVDPTALEWDLFGDDLLAERGLALAEDDRRAVGEALAHQLEFTDVVVLGDEPPTDHVLGDEPPARVDRTRTLLAHLVADEPDLRPVGALGPAGLLGPRVDDDRGDPRHARPTGAPDADGVWTLDLHSWRPLHPERLLAELPTLGEGWLRARGRFWLPTRPDTVAVWDGAGGQLSVGALGTWESRPETRIVVTGLDEDPSRLREAFVRALLTDTELARGLHRWAGVEDGFDEWLGAEDLSA